MKKIIIISILCSLSFNSFSQSALVCEDEDISQTITEAIVDTTFDPTYDFVMFTLYYYYERYYKYPENIDTFINYLHYASLHSTVESWGRDIEDVREELEQLKHRKLSAEERWELSHYQVAFNYCYINRSETNFIYETDYIIFLCGADSIYLTYRKIDACVDRYPKDRGIRDRFVPVEGIRFYDKTGELIHVDIEEIKNLYKLISSIIRDKYKEIWVDDERPRMTAIPKYNKEDGLSSFCPNDNIDFENDHFFIDVKNIFSNFLMDYSNIHSMIIPLYCCESKTTYSYGLNPQIIKENKVSE